MKDVAITKKITRRAFLRRAALTGLGLATIGPAGWLSHAFAQTTSPLVVVIGSDPVTMDPHRDTRYSAASLFSNIYEGLLSRSAQGELIPGLATAWSLEDDLNTVFTLRDGVTFHNGEPFDAISAKTSLDRARSDEMLDFAFRALVDPITNVEVLEEFKLRITTSVPAPLQLARLASFKIVPQEFLAINGDDALTLMAVGTGPYELVEWVPDSEIVVKCFEGYWGEAPSIKSAVIRKVPEPATRLIELLSGGADILANFIPEQIPAVDSANNANTLTISGNSFISAFFNPIDPASPLRNRLVRQALNLAVDINAIIEFVLEGLGEPIATLVTPLDFGFNPDVEPFGFDPDEALRLLDQAGYPDGFSTSMTTIRGFQSIAEAMVGFLAEINVKVDLEVRDFGLLIQQILSRTTPEEIFIFDSSSPEFDAENSFNAVVNFLNTEQLLSPAHHEEFNQLINTTRSTTDPTVRRAAFSRLQEIIKDEPVAIYSHTQKTPFGLSDRIDWPGRVDGLIRISEIEIK